MGGIQNLAKIIKQSVQTKIENEARARRGTIQNGQFVSGNESYPIKQAVDVDVSNGARVWAQLDNNGNAVVVGS